MISRQSSEPTRIWRNGAWIDETDLMASGNPPAASPAPLPALDAWTLDTGTPSAGIEVRVHKSKKYYRATASLDDPRYDGEKGPVYSKEYLAVDAADSPRLTGDHISITGERQHQADISAAVRRSHMKPDEKSPRDMALILKELENDLLYPYKLWQQKLERHVTRLRASSELRAVIDIMSLDVEENGMTDEYQQFAKQLSQLLKGTE